MIYRTYVQYCGGTLYFACFCRNLKIFKPNIKITLSPNFLQRQSPGTPCGTRKRLQIHELPVIHAKKGKQQKKLFCNNPCQLIRTVV